MSATIAALILAGGYSRRMGRDKAWVEWSDQALWMHVQQRLSQQNPHAITDVWVNTREETNKFQQAIQTGQLQGQVLDAPELAGLGPLAGMQAGLKHINSDWLLVVPCDTPRLPEDLLQRLKTAVETQQVPLGVAASKTSDGVRVHPTAALLHRSLRSSIEQQLHAQDLKLMRWLDSQPHTLAVWDEDWAFANVNSTADLALLPKPSASA